MRPMTLKVDHITVCGSNLEAMRHAFARVGLSTTYGGPHSNGATHMDLLPFDDGSYLELIAPITSMSGASGMMSGWTHLMEADAGAGAWAVRTDDIHSEVRCLRAAGIEVRGPEAGSRQRPDGTQLEWETAIIGPSPAGSLLPFLIQDKTPRRLRVPSSDATSDIGGVAAVVIGVRDIKKATELYRSGFGWDAPQIADHSEFGAVLAYFMHSPVILAAPLDTGSWLQERLERFGECPAAFLLAPCDDFDIEAHFAATEQALWFGKTVAWLDQEKLMGARLGFMTK